MRIDYNHSQNAHGTAGPLAAFRLIVETPFPKSLLDVGCGVGTWLSSAAQNGIDDFYGIDGVEISPKQLLIPREKFKRVDLQNTVDLGRRFDLVMCLEVAEHLDERSSDILIDTLVRHGDKIIFSAACPGQGGQNHINCQWPSWWQKKFNERGFECNDSVRWAIWNETAIESWYRQNMFTATRNPKIAGNEPRIRSVIHPEIVPGISEQIHFNRLEKSFEDGFLDRSWYFKKPIVGLLKKILRKL